MFAEFCHFDSYLVGLRTVTETSDKELNPAGTSPGLSSKNNAIFFCDILRSKSVKSIIIYNKLFE